MTKATASSTSSAAAARVVAPLERLQQAYHESLEKAFHLNLDALQAHGKAQLAFFHAVAKATPETGLNVLGEASKAYLQDAQERSTAYVQSSLALTQNVGAKVQQAVSSSLVH